MWVEQVYTFPGWGVPCQQGLKLTTSRRPGDVINCHREDFYSLSGRLRDEENFAGTDLIFLIKFHFL